MSNNKIISKFMFYIEQERQSNKLNNLEKNKLLHTRNPDMFSPST